MTDVFGNYVIQKFFEFGSNEQKTQLVNKVNPPAGGDISASDPIIAPPPPNIPLPSRNIVLLNASRNFRHPYLLNQKLLQKRE
jgi:hypothetical protein